MHRAAEAARREQQAQDRRKAIAEIDATRTSRRVLVPRFVPGLTSWHRRVGAALLGPAIATGALVWFAHWAWRRRSREVRRFGGPGLEVAPGPSLFWLAPRERHWPPLLAVEAREALVWGVGQAVTEERTRLLDLNATITATIEHGGLPELRFRHRRRLQRVWLWHDQSAAGPIAARLCAEVQQTLHGYGLAVEVGRFWGLPERLERDDGRLLSLDALDEEREFSTVVVLTDGDELLRQWEWRDPNGHSRQQQVRALLGRLAAWPQLTVVHTGTRERMRALRALLEPFGIPCVPLEAFPLAVRDRDHVARTPGALASAENVWMWAALCALYPLPVPEAQALALLRHLDLPISPLSLGQLMEQSVTTAGIQFKPNVRARLIERLRRTLDDGSGGLPRAMRRALAFWRAETIADDPDWAEDTSGRGLHRRLVVALLDVWSDPERAARELSALWKSPQMPAIREELARMRPTVNKPGAPEPGSFHVPLDPATLSPATRTRLQAAGMAGLVTPDRDGSRAQSVPIAGGEPFGRLVRGHLRRLFADRRTLLVLLLQAPLLGALLLLVAEHDALQDLDATHGRTLLYLLGLAAMWCGMSNAVLEDDDTPALDRSERLAVVRIGAHVASKVCVFAGLCSVQTLMLLAVLAIEIDFSAELVELHGEPVHFVRGAFLEPFGFVTGIGITTFLASLTGLGLGLLIVRVTSSFKRALGLVPLVLASQAVCALAVMPLPASLAWLSYASALRFATEAYGALVHLPLPRDYTDCAIPGDSFSCDPYPLVGDVLFARDVIQLWRTQAAYTLVCLLTTLLLIARARAGRTRPPDEPDEEGPRWLRELGLLAALMFVASAALLAVDVGQTRKPATSVGDLWPLAAPVEPDMGDRRLVHVAGEWRDIGTWPIAEDLDLGTESVEVKCSGDSGLRRCLAEGAAEPVTAQRIAILDAGRDSVDAVRFADSLLDRGLVDAAWIGEWPPWLTDRSVRAIGGGRELEMWVFTIDPGFIPKDASDDRSPRYPAILGGATGRVIAANFCGDAVCAVTASGRLAWLLRGDLTGTTITELRGHDASVTAAAISPDGQRIVTASADTTARVWTADGTPHPVPLRGHTGAILSVGWSPDGQRIVTASADKTARTWDADGTEEPLVFRGHEDAVLFAAFSWDGGRIVTTSADRTARVWDKSGARMPVVFTGHEDRVHAAAWSADSQRIATVSDDRTVQAWAVDDPGSAVVFAGDAAVLSAVWSPDDQHILAGTRDDIARVWDLAKGVKRAAIGPQPAMSQAEQIVLRHGVGPGIGNVAFSPDGAYMLTASWAGTVRVWTADGRPVSARAERSEASLEGLRPWDEAPSSWTRIHRSTDWPHLLAAFPEDKDWAPPTDRSEVAFVEVPQDPRALLVTDVNGPVTAATGIGDGRLIVGNRSGRLVRWSTTAGAGRKALAHRGAVAGLASAMGFSLAVDDDGTGRVWDHGNDDVIVMGSPIKLGAASLDRSALWVATQSGEVLALDGPRQRAPVPNPTWGTVVDALVSRSSGDVAVLSGGAIHVCEKTDEWACRAHEVELAPHLLAVSPVGDTFAVASQEVVPTIEVFSTLGVAPRKKDPAPRELRFRGPIGWPVALKYSPDGARLAVASLDGTVWLAKADGGEDCPLILRHETPLADIAFSRDGSLLATGSFDGDVRVFRVADGAGPVRLAGHRGPVRSVSFLPEDGGRVLSVSDDGSARIWAAPAAEAFAGAEAGERLCVAESAPTAKPDPPRPRRGPTLEAPADPVRPVYRELAVPGGVTIDGLSDDAEHEYQQGAQAYALGDYGQAVRHFERSHQLSGLPTLLYNLGLAYARWHDLDRDPSKLRKARQSFQEYAKNEADQGERAKAERLIALIDEQIKDDADVAAAITTKQPLTFDPRLEYLRGEQAYALANYDQAARHFERGYKLSGSSDHLYNLGMTYAQWYDLKPDVNLLHKARRHFRDYLKRLPSDSDSDPSRREDAETQIARIDALLAAAAAPPAR